MSSKAIITVVDANKTNKIFVELREFDFKIFLKIIINIGNVNIAILIGPVSCKKRKLNGKYNRGNIATCHFKFKDFVISKIREFELNGKCVKETHALRNAMKHVMKGRGIDRKKWNIENEKYFLLEYILPNEDLEDISILSKNISSIEDYDFEEIINKYDIDDYIVAIIYKNND